MKRSNYWLLPLVLIVLVVSCKKNDGYSGTKPRFRVHNFSPGSPALYMTLDGWQNTGNPISYLQYGGFGEYPYDNKGSQKLKVYSPASNATYLEKEVNMADHYTYSIFVSNLFTTMDYLMIPVFNDYSNDYGKCKVRFINLSPNAGAVKVVQGTDTLFTNIGYLAASDYKEIPMGDKMTTIYSADNKFLFSDRSHYYNGLQVKDIILSGFLEASDTTFRAKLTIVEER